MTRAHHASVFGSALIILACMHSGQINRELDPVAQRLFGSGPSLRCEGFQAHEVLGPLTGCWAKRTDTLVFLYYNGSGDVVSYGRNWTVDSAGAQSTYDSLARLLTNELHNPVLVCDTIESGWEIKDRRWNAASGHQALVLQFGRPDLGSGPSIKSVKQINQPSCSDRYPLPLAR